MEETKLRQALLLGAEMLIEHGLGDWTVGLHNKRKVLADCNNNRKTIRYSKNFIKVAEKDQFQGVTLHEIAHALVGAGHGHDRVFKRKVLEISPNAEYSHANVENPVHTHKYNLVCPECGTASRSNSNRGYICGRCSKEGKRIPLEVSENVLQVIVW